MHVYQFEGEHWNNQILFRDYLRNNPDVVKEYQQLKMDLAEIFRFDRVSYTKNKATFIHKVILKAQEEKERLL